MNLKGIYYRGRWPEQASQGRSESTVWTRVQLCRESAPDSTELVQLVLPTPLSLSVLSPS
jgi:hypothetical protein